MELNTLDFDTTQKIVAAVNNQFGMGTAIALDGRTIQLRAPTDPSQVVSFMAQLENIDVRPSQGAAKVILNARTGSIVMNQMVTLQNCAVAHGNLSVVINTTTAVSQPGAFSNGTNCGREAVEYPVEAGHGRAQVGCGKRDARGRGQGVECPRRDAGRFDLDLAVDESGGCVARRS